MKLLGSTTFEGKEYVIEDVRGFVEHCDFGLPEGFYGGRVDKVAKTDYAEIFLLIEKHEVIDIVVFETVEIPFDNDNGVDYHKYTNDELRAMLLELGIDAPKKATKDELVSLFNKED